MNLFSIIAIWTLFFVFYSIDGNILFTNEEHSLDKQKEIAKNLYNDGRQKFTIKGTETKCKEFICSYSNSYDIINGTKAKHTTASDASVTYNLSNFTDNIEYKVFEYAYMWAQTVQKNVNEVYISSSFTSKTYNRY